MPKGHFCAILSIRHRTYRSFPWLPSLDNLLGLASCSALYITHSQLLARKMTFSHKAQISLHLDSDLHSCSIRGPDLLRSGDGEVLALLRPAPVPLSLLESWSTMVVLRRVLSVGWCWIRPSSGPSCLFLPDMLILQRGLRAGVSYRVFCNVIKDYEESAERLLVMGRKLLNRS